MTDSEKVREIMYKLTAMQIRINRDTKKRGAWEFMEAAWNKLDKPLSDNVPIPEVKQ